jgi:hypothetical protein
MSLHVFSGKVDLGKIGILSAVKDYRGEDLYVGDIILTQYSDKFGVNYVGGLTCIVQSEGITFVMGIRDKCISGEINQEFGWQVVKVKSWKDIVDGESWPDFGFNYKNIND